MNDQFDELMKTKEQMSDRIQIPSTSYYERDWLAWALLLSIIVILLGKAVW